MFKTKKHIFFNIAFFIVSSCERVIVEDEDSDILQKSTCHQMFSNKNNFACVEIFSHFCINKRGNKVVKDGICPEKIGNQKKEKCMEESFSSLDSVNKNYTYGDTPCIKANNLIN